MSYAPTQWNTGDVVTAEKLNKLEQGVAAAGGGSGDGNLLVVDATATRTNDAETNENIVSTVTFDKTFAELKSAYEGGAVMLCRVKTEDYVNFVFWDSIAFLNYRPATQLPFPAPEAFFFNASSLQIGSVVYGCSAGCEIDAEGTAAQIQTANLTGAN